LPRGCHHRALVRTSLLRHHDIDAPLFEQPVQPSREARPAFDGVIGRQRPGQLDQQVDVAATPAVVDARAEQQHARAGGQRFAAGALDRLAFGG